MALILIADGSPLSCTIIEGVVAESGHRAIRAHDGIEALEIIYRDAPDCIIAAESLPLLSGSHLSSLIKSRRAVSAIPFILVNDPATSGPLAFRNADAVIDFDPDDTIELSAALEGLTGAEIPRAEIAASAPQLKRENLYEIALAHLEEQLGAADVMNRLGDIGRDLAGSLPELVMKGLALLPAMAGFHVAVFITDQWKRAEAFVHTDRDLYRSDADDFMLVCLNDYYGHFASLNLDDVRRHYFNVDSRDDFDRVRIDGRKISSYFFRAMKNNEGKIIGTLHLGHFSNNYYVDVVTAKIDRFLRGFSQSVDNALKYAREHEMRKKIHHVFSKFVPEEIITSLVEKESDAELMVGEKRKIVVLFSDIRSFTTITESNHPEEVVSFLNRYFDTQVAIIKKYGGNIDKFIGDAIFAIFGAPISYENNVERAVNAAMEMINILGEIDISKLVMPGGQLKIGIGLHEGDAIVGNIGSSTKFDYTAIGDTVNLAARLEGYTKHYHREVLLSQTVAEKIAGSLPVREVDFVKVKGKDIATSLFTVEFDPAIMAEPYLDTYYKAYKMYQLGNFVTALEYYHELKKMIHDDPIVDMFIERCRDYISTPPQNWDGSLTLEFK